MSANPSKDPICIDLIVAAFALDRLKRAVSVKLGNTGPWTGQLESPSWSRLQLLPCGTSPTSWYTAMQPWTSLAVFPVNELQTVACRPKKFERIGT